MFTTVHRHPPSYTTIHHSPPSITIPHRLQEEKCNGNGKTEQKATAVAGNAGAEAPVGVVNLLISEQLVKIPVRYP
ncbi:hypothetical protein Tco_1119844 [Tanacetum coccineum]